ELSRNIVEHCVFAPHGERAEVERRFAFSSQLPPYSLQRECRSDVPSGRGYADFDIRINRTRSALDLADELLIQKRRFGAKFSNETLLQETRSAQRLNCLPLNTKIVETSDATSYS